MKTSHVLMCLMITLSVLISNSASKKTHKKLKSYLDDDELDRGAPEDGTDLDERTPENDEDHEYEHEPGDDEDHEYEHEPGDDEDDSSLGLKTYNEDEPGDDDEPEDSAAARRRSYEEYLKENRDEVLREREDKEGREENLKEIENMVKRKEIQRKRKHRKKKHHKFIYTPKMHMANVKDELRNLANIAITNLKTHKRLQKERKQKMLQWKKKLKNMKAEGKEAIPYQQTIEEGQRKTPITKPLCADICQHRCLDSCHIACCVPDLTPRMRSEIARRMKVGDEKDSCPEKCQKTCDPGCDFKCCLPK